VRIIVAVLALCIIGFVVAPATTMTIIYNLSDAVVKVAPDVVTLLQAIAEACSRLFDGIVIQSR
jgi:hypothetical protein